MRRRIGGVHATRGELGVATDHRHLLQHQNACARIKRGNGGRQSGATGTDDDDIETFRGAGGEYRQRCNHDGHSHAKHCTSFHDFPLPYFFTLPTFIGMLKAWHLVQYASDVSWPLWQVTH